MMANDRILKPVSKAAENRKLPKPLIEKKRRARINKSLCELKSLIGDVLRKEMQTTRRKRKSGKVEKADVLELTVKYLKEVKHLNYNLKHSANDGFQRGYAACIAEIERYLTHNSGHSTETSDRDQFIHASLIAGLQRKYSMIKSERLNRTSISVIQHTNSLSKSDGGQTDGIWRPW